MTTELTPKTLEAWSAAAQHLLDCGMTPIIPIEVLRLLWQRGERELSERIVRAGGDAA